MISRIFSLRLQPHDARAGRPRSRSRSSSGSSGRCVVDRLRSCRSSPEPCALIVIAAIFLLWGVIRFLKWWNARAKNAALLNQIAQDDGKAAAAATPAGAEEIAELRRRFDAAVEDAQAEPHRKRQGRVLLALLAPLRVPDALVHDHRRAGLGQDHRARQLRHRVPAGQGVRQGRDPRRGRHAQLRLVVHQRRGAARHRRALHDAGEQRGGRPAPSGRASFRSCAASARARRSTACSSPSASRTCSAPTTSSASATRRLIRRALRGDRRGAQDALPDLRARHQDRPPVGLQRVLRATVQRRARAGVGLHAAARGERVRRRARDRRSAPSSRSCRSASRTRCPTRCRASSTCSAAASSTRSRRSSRACARCWCASSTSLFAPSKFTPRPLVRGVYFTSGTQEGTPFDRVLSAIQRQFGVAASVQNATAAQGSGRSYFLRNLLQKVIFAEAHVVERNPTRDRRRRLVQAVGVAACVILLAGSLVAWLVSYSNNAATSRASTRAPRRSTRRSRHAQHHRRRPRVAAADPRRGAGAAAQRQVRHRLAADVVPLRPLPGRDVKTVANGAYDRLLEDLLLPRIALRIRRLLQETPPTDLEALYKRLEAYLMLYDPEHYRAQFLLDAVTADWRANEASQPADRGAEGARAAPRAPLRGPAAAVAVPDRRGARRGRAHAPCELHAVAAPVQPDQGDRRGPRRGGEHSRLHAGDRGRSRRQARVRAHVGQVARPGRAALFTRDGYRVFSDMLQNRKNLVTLDEPWVLGKADKSAAQKARTWSTTASSTTSAANTWTSTASCGTASSPTSTCASRRTCATRSISRASCPGPTRRSPR